MKYLKLVLLFVASGLSIASANQAKKNGILMIGDSLTVGNMANEVLELVSAEIGGRIRIIGSGGSKPSDWTQGEAVYNNTWGYSDYSNTEKSELGRPDIYKNPYHSPKLPDLIKQEQPEIVVIQQGTNLMWDLPDNADLSIARKQVQGLYKQIFISTPAPRKCLWVAPPDTSKMSSIIEDRMFHLISDIVSMHCKVLDSRDPQRIGVYPHAAGKYFGDGVHHKGVKGGEELQKRWARAIVDEIKELRK